jgi:WD40 repeat protein
MSSVNDSGFITRSSSRLSRSAPPSLSARARRWTQNLLSRNIAAPLDRIRELGNDEDYGHTGYAFIRLISQCELTTCSRCVNAISWAQDGQLLLTGGDDTTSVDWSRSSSRNAQLHHSVRLWRVDPTNLTDEYPLVCTSVIETGHIANIFAAHMLPHSTRM